MEEDYKDIPDEVLAAPPVFNFLDDAGFKFVMPAIMRWSLKSTTEDKKEVLAFFAYKLIPESRKADKPDVLAQKWKLSKEQIQVIVEWLEFYTFNYLTYPSELEAAQIERWKKLAE